MDRLSSLDASFLYIESGEAPLNIGTVSIFQAPDSGFDHERLVTLIRRRLALSPVIASGLNPSHWESFDRYGSMILNLMCPSMFADPHCLSQGPASN